MNYIVALGSNLPRDRLGPADILARAIWLFEGAGLRVLDQSGFYETPAQPQGAGPDFVSAVVVVDTDRDLDAVIGTLDQIEVAAGDFGPKGGAARVLDVDLLAQDDRVLPDELTVRRTMEHEGATGPMLPHPQLHRRGYVLVPLAEVRPDWRHPLLGRTAVQLLADLPAVALEGIRPIDGLIDLGREQTKDVAE